MKDLNSQVTPEHLSHLLTKRYVAKSRKAHGNRFDYSRTVFLGRNHGHVTVGCPVHGFVSINYSSHLKGAGYPLCAEEVRKAKLSMGLEEFIARARKLHGDLYDYSKVVYINALLKVEIVCREHGSFWQIPRDHLAGKGCRACGRLAIAATKRGNQENFVKNAIRVHGYTYDYSKVVYRTDKIPVMIGCRVHGYFSQKPNTHLNGAGCSKCADERGALDRTKTTAQFIAEAVVIHGSECIYSEVVYRGVEHKVKIVCPKHGPFKQAPASHLAGKGCPVCRSSHGEKRIRNILVREGIKFIREFKFPVINLNYRYDFFLYELNILIEFHGKQHFEPQRVFGGEESFHKQLFRDRMKKELAKDTAIPLLEFDYMQLRWPKEDFERHVINTINAVLARRDRTVEILKRSLM